MGSAAMSNQGEAMKEIQKGKMGDPFQVILEVFRIDPHRSRPWMCPSAPPQGLRKRIVVLGSATHAPYSCWHHSA